MNNIINLDELTTIETVNPRSTRKADLTYSEKTNKFTVSDDAYLAMNLEHRGLKMHIHPQGYILISTHGEEDATFMKRRGTATKGRQFTNSEMRRMMDMHKLEGKNDFAIQPVGEKDGSPHFLIRPWTQEDAKTGSPLNQIAETQSTVSEVTETQQEPEEVQQVDPVTEAFGF
jgi:hypothetical protein